MSEKRIERLASHSPDRFLNRELSWLAFNSRVLEEAMNPLHPLLERLNFLAISASNLDEFYMVRVAGLKDYIREGITTESIDGLTPGQELGIVHERTLRLIEQQHECWQRISGEMDEENIMIVQRSELSRSDTAWLSEYFFESIFPALTPIAIDPAHPFPFLPNLGLALIFQLSTTEPEESAHHEQTAIVPLPMTLPRFIRLPGKPAWKLRFVLLEDIIELFMDALFPNFRKLDSAIFRIVRDSELDVEDEADDFVRNFERAVKQRRRGRVIRLRFMEPASAALVDFVASQMHIEADSVMTLKGLLGMAHLKEIVEEASHVRPDLRFAPFKVRFPERINDFGGDCFAAIAAKDIVIHHPFESFDVVTQFVRQAADDPNVVSIKQTLYRTSKDSPIVHALIQAAEAGKSVTALVELKARFDEETNMRFARELERAGVQVVYGFVALKTHAKVTLISRREGAALKSYAHFGTGNYHPATARVYTDLSFFTCDPEICRDAAYLFNFVTGYAPPRAFRKLIVAPRHLRRRVLQLIAQEADHARAGKPGAIWAKMNSLVDPAIIDALYDASQAGVQIDLVVRGICCLRPGVAGLSENIRVKSIVGRFLEHSRLYCFGAGFGLPSSQAKVFIGSADWMPRNFDGRVEVMVPIENATVHAQVLDQIMMANLKDERQSWHMQPDGTYSRPTINPQSFSAHEYFINNPSLSGRGSALKKLKSSQGQKYKAVKGGKS